MFQFWSNLKAARKERRRLKKFEAAQSWSKGLDLQEAFERVYSEKKWGDKGGDAEFWSGNGSNPQFSTTYENFVTGFIDSRPDIERIVDIGCGDFQVSGRILARLARPVSYTGCDIVRPMIEHHRQKHGGPGREFRVLNAVAEDPPEGDLVFIRQILQHLSNAQVAAILERAQRLYRCAIITESLPKEPKAPNLDIVSGSATRVPLRSGVFIDAPPYNLKPAEQFDVSHSADELMRTWVVWFRD